MDSETMIIVYERCLIFGITFSLITIVFSFLFDNVLDNLLDIIMPFDDFINPTVILAFVGFLGGMGLFLSQNTSLTPHVVLILSTMFSIIVATALHFLYFKPMKKSENSLAFFMENLVGKTAETLTSIEPEKFGEIIIHTGTTKVNKVAASSNGLYIESNADVIIDEIKDGIIYVSKIT